MSSKKITIEIILILSVIVLIWPQPTLAYLDPGSGSYMIQMLIAGMVGFGFVFRNYWKKIKDLFKPKTDDKKD